MQLINPLQIKQQLLWDQIVTDWLDKQQNNNNHEVGYYGSLNSWQLAVKAKEAFEILTTYQIPVSKIKKYFWHQEAKIFLEWINNYQSNFLDLNYPATVFKSSLQQQTLATNNDQKSNYFKIACRNFIEEINYAAKFAVNNRLVGKVGIAILDLENNYQQINYIFSNYLTKDEYDVMVAPRLNNFSLINISLLILQIADCYINKEDLKYQDFSKLLRTKYILGAKQELGSRAYVDYILREQVDYKFKWEYIKKYLLTALKDQSKDNNSIKIFMDLCDKFTKFIQHKNSIDQLEKQPKYNSDYWSLFIQEILAAFGWCQENITDEEQHMINCWQDLLHQYKELKFVGQHSFTECIKLLIKLSKIYVTQDLDIMASNFNNKHKNILIVDFNAAVKIQFDYLWICSLSELNYPPNPQFNPFLPVALQKELGVNCVGGQLSTNSNIFADYLQRLINNTNAMLVCSFPLYLDNNLVRPSKLIKDLPEFNCNYLNKISFVDINQNKFIDQHSKLQPEVYTDDNVPIYPSDQFSGTQIFKLQAACPFQANAKIRLQLNSLKNPTPYLSKAIKGDIIHKTLAEFWAQHKNSYELKKTDLAIIKKQLLAIAYKILYKLQKIKPTTLHHTILQLEADRIVELCFNFIEKYDLNRSEFTVIHLEEKIIVKLNEFSINVKIDRIDELVNGELIVIDYKSGKSTSISSLNFNNHEIDDPQLLIYSLYSPKIKATILACIKPGRLELLGAVDSNFNLTSLYDSFNLTKLTDFKYLIINNWQENLSRCYKKLYQLAYEFKNGLAIVNPKHGATTCKHCDLKYVCRVFDKS